MNADIVKQMRLEEADLARKLQAVRNFLAAYGESPVEPKGEKLVKNVAPPSPSRKNAPITSFTEQTRTSVVLAMQAMSVNDKLMKTSELVNFIAAMGHEVSGSNKVNALGALLARSADVVGHGKSGWSLADRENALAIVNEYAPKENEPHSRSAGGSDAGVKGDGQPFPPFVQPPDQTDRW